VIIQKKRGGEKKKVAFLVEARREATGEKAKGFSITWEGVPGKVKKKFFSGGDEEYRTTLVGVPNALPTLMNHTGLGGGDVTGEGGKRKSCRREWQAKNGKKKKNLLVK